MPKVPDYGPAPTAPMAEPPKPEFLMMAAAVMHEQGRLFEEPKPLDNKPEPR